MTNGTTFTMRIARLPHLGHLTEDELSEDALTPFGYPLEWAGPSAFFRHRLRFFGYHEP